MMPVEGKRDMVHGAERPESVDATFLQEGDDSIHDRADFEAVADAGEEQRRL